MAQPRFQRVAVRGAHLVAAIVRDEQLELRSQLCASCGTGGSGSRAASARGRTVTAISQPGHPCSGFAMGGLRFFTAPVRSGVLSPASLSGFANALILRDTRPTLLASPSSMRGLSELCDLTGFGGLSVPSAWRLLHNADFTFSNSASEKKPSSLSCQRRGRDMSCSTGDGRGSDIRRRSAAVGTVTAGTAPAPAPAPAPGSPCSVTLSFLFVRSLATLLLLACLQHELMVSSSANVVAGPRILSRS
mmetsp:Transcript_1530/g.4327  ORF Transcript_1530/g.4327 Transcript_1530/m.4327 type:complete len:247 (-) Transcript_1530:480-1220(-)